MEAAKAARESSPITFTTPVDEAQAAKQCVKEQMHLSPDIKKDTSLLTRNYETTNFVNKVCDVDLNKTTHVVNKVCDVECHPDLKANMCTLDSRTPWTLWRK